MSLVTLPKLACDRCGQPHELSFYEDDSIRGSVHLNCSKPVPGPPNPPRLLDKGKFWLVATTCVECGTKQMDVTQMRNAVHKTVQCKMCLAQQSNKGPIPKPKDRPKGDKTR